jgi:hypothetical protein
MEPRREEPKAARPSSRDRHKPEIRIAPVVIRERPFRMERLEERITPITFVYGQLVVR